MTREAVTSGSTLDATCGGSPLLTPTGNETVGTPLVGRGVELDAVVSAIKGACVGRSVPVLISGEAGAGKSRLLAEALVQAESFGCRVLATRIDELDRALPYAPLRDAFGAALDIETDATLVDEVRDLRAALLLDGGRSSGRSNRESLELAHASGERLLRSWANRQPLVLAIDDLHSCDADSLALLSVLIRRLRDARCTIVGTFRNEHSHCDELNALVERFSATGLVRVVALDPLDEADTGAVVQSMTGCPPDHALVELLWDRCRGNPMLLEQTLECLLAAGAVVADLGQLRLVGDPPVVTISSRSALLNRVRQLGPEALALGRALTLFPRIDIERLDLVARLAALEPRGAVRSFDQLVAANVLKRQRDGRYEFNHPVVRDTIYEDLGPAERRRLHGELAALLQGELDAGGDVPLSELATHVAVSARRGDANAIAVLSAAGEEVASTAPASAAAWFGKAISLLPDADVRRWKLLAGRARALALASQFEESNVAALEAIALLPHRWEERQKLEIRVVSNLIALGRFEEALARAESSIAEVETAGRAPHHRLLERRAAVLMIMGQLDEAEAAARAVVALAHEDTVTCAMAIGTLAAVAFNRGALNECRERFDDQLALAAASPGCQLDAIVTRGIHMAMAGHLGDARSSIAEARSLVRTRSLTAYQGIIATGDAFVGWLGGEWDTALDNAARARLMLVSTGQRYTLGLVVGVEASILVERGRYEDAERVLEAVGQGLVGESFLASARSGIALGLDRLDDAREILRVSLDDRATQRTVGATHLLLDRLLEVDLRSGNAPGARATANELMTLAERTGSTWVRLVAERARGRALQDVASLSRAVELAERESLPFEAAVTRVELGRVTSDVRVLQLAFDQLDRLGAEPMRRRAAALLRGLGQRVASRPRRVGQELSETDLEIARLIREGCSNRQIARVLCLSPKTIENYLTRLYERTGCSSRLELALAVESGRIQVSR